MDVQAEFSRNRQGMFAGRGGMIAFTRYCLEVSSRIARDITVACRDATEGCEIIVGTGLAYYVGMRMAEYWQVPCVHGFMQPLLATRDFPPPLGPLPPFALPGWLNRLSNHVIGQLAWIPMRILANRAMRDVLGLPPSPLRVPVDIVRARGDPVLMAHSRYLLPHASDWEANIHVTGFWFLDAAKGWNPPDDLVRFLNAGPPPVYVGFGSMLLKKPLATLETVLATINQAGCRAVISAGWGGLRAENLPSHVFAIDEAPHDWLFPRMAAIIHHAGAGTTGAALRAGKPSVAVPFLLDQFFWAWRLHEIGVAPKTVPYRKLTAETLGTALTEALSDEAIQAKATALNEKVRAENGVDKAIAIIERTAQKSKGDRHADNTATAAH